MPAEQPMTADQIRTGLQHGLQSGGLWSAAIGMTIQLMLDWMKAREQRDAEVEEMKRRIGEMGKIPTNTEGPRGTTGCACISRNALECAQQAYYAGVAARERCGCLCHQWATDDAKRAADKGA